MLTVLNRHHGNPKGQYIGRGTPLGNPFKVEKGRTRRQAIEQFRKWAINALADERHRSPWRPRKSRPGTTPGKTSA